LLFAVLEEKYRRITGAREASGLRAKKQRGFSGFFPVPGPQRRYFNQMQRGLFFGENSSFPPPLFRIYSPSRPEGRDPFVAVLFGPLRYDRPLSTSPIFSGTENNMFGRPSFSVVFLPSSPALSGVFASFFVTTNGWQKHRLFLFLFSLKPLSSFWLFRSGFSDLLADDRAFPEENKSPPPSSVVGPPLQIEVRQA